MHATFYATLSDNDIRYNKYLSPSALFNHHVDEIKNKWGDDYREIMRLHFRPFFICPHCEKEIIDEGNDTREGCVVCLDCYHSKVKCRHI